LTNKTVEDNTQTKYNSKANKAEYTISKPFLFNRLLQHLVRKRGGHIPTRSDC